MTAHPATSDVRPLGRRSTTYGLARRSREWEALKYRAVREERDALRAEVNRLRDAAGLKRWSWSETKRGTRA